MLICKKTGLIPTVNPIVVKEQLAGIAGADNVPDKPDVLESHSRDFSQGARGNGIKACDSLELVAKATAK